jgi:hypothetical protein
MEGMAMALASYPYLPGDTGAMVTSMLCTAVLSPMSALWPGISMLPHSERSEVIFSPMSQQNLGTGS